MLKEWRKKAYLTQAELAKQLGVAQNTVSCWERGNAIPDIFTAEKLSKILNVPITDIIEHFKLAVNEE